MEADNSGLLELNLVKETDETRDAIQPWMTTQVFICASLPAGQQDPPLKCQLQTCLDTASPQSVGSGPPAGTRADLQDLLGEQISETDGLVVISR